MSIRSDLTRSDGQGEQCELRQPACCRDLVVSGREVESQSQASAAQQGHSDLVRLIQIFSDAPRKPERRARGCRAEARRPTTRASTTRPVLSISPANRFLSPWISPAAAAAAMPRSTWCQCHRIRTLRHGECLASRCCDPRHPPALRPCSFLPSSSLFLVSPPTLCVHHVCLTS